MLLIPKRKVLRFNDLSQEEVTDLFISSQKVSVVLEREVNSLWFSLTLSQFRATSLTFAIQDGKDAGQTVEHVHLHIMPRKKGDFAHNDEVYAAVGSNCLFLIFHR